MTGFRVVGLASHQLRPTFTKSVYVVFWDAYIHARPSVDIKPDGGEYLPSRHLQSLTPGAYVLRRPAVGLIYECCSKDECEEHRVALEADEYPLPDSMRVTGFQGALTSLGYDRGRLSHMYKTGSDTAAIYLLLLHGA